MQNNLTEEQKVDVEVRTKEFETELKALSDRLQMQITTFPQWIPTQQGFTTISQIGLKDTKYQPVESPFIQNK